MSLVETARSPLAKLCSDQVHAATSLLGRKCYEVVRIVDTNIFTGAVTEQIVTVSAKNPPTLLTSHSTLLEGIFKHLPKPIEVLADLFCSQTVHEAGLEEESSDVLFLQFACLLSEGIILCVVCTDVKNGIVNFARGCEVIEYLHASDRGQVGCLGDQVLMDHQ